MEGDLIGNLLDGTTPTTSESMDKKRGNTTVQDFLQKLDQAREWVHDIIQDEIVSDIKKFKEELPKGEILARVVQSFDRNYVKRIHHSDTKEYKHVDNIMVFLNWLKKIKLRKHFIFETVDLYDSKNIPKVIYCIHGLAQFLKKRGTSRGIIVRKDKIFSNDEADMFSEDLRNITAQRFDDIENRLDSEDMDEELFSENEEERTICSFSKTAIWKHSFQSIIFDRNVDVQSLKKFIIFPSSEDLINKQNAEICSFFINNFEMEQEKEEILRSAALLIDNKNSLRNGGVLKYQNLGNFKKIVYFLINEPGILIEIKRLGFELPFRTLFPDNLLGDYYFLNFIKNVEQDFESLEIVKNHFLSSKYFSEIVDVFKGAVDLTLNPISIYQSLYKKTVMLEDALSSKEVQEEIIKRSEKTMNLVNKIQKCLINIQLPNYVKLFIKHPLFYEKFIYPAILISERSALLSIFNFIYEDKLEDLKIIKNSDTFEKSNNLDFSDFSVIKEFLEDCRNTFKSEFINSQIIDNELIFKNQPSSNYHIEMTYSEVNNLILILKEFFKISVKNNSDSKQTLCNLVSRQESLKHNLQNEFILELHGKGMGEHLNVFKEVRIQEELKKDTDFDEKIVIDLNNHFNKDNSGNSFILKELKTMLVLLISLSDKNDLSQILESLNDYEVSEIIKNDLDPVVVDGIRDKCKRSYELLHSKMNKTRRETNCFILNSMANDILVSKHRLQGTEIELNKETLDDLFEKKSDLESVIVYLRTYLNNLAFSMFTNKSGCCSSKSKYGTYRGNISQVCGHVYENISNVQFEISCNQPLIFNFDLFLNGKKLCESKIINFDDLLKKKDDGVLCFDSNDVCCISVSPLIDFINKKYIK